MHAAPWYPSRRIVLLAGVLSVQCGSSEREGVHWCNPFHHRLAVCADRPTLDGIDVSKWQNTINWDKVEADGIDFAFIRVSDGVEPLADGSPAFDPYFDRNMAEAKRVGIVRGVYQFFRPTEDPIGQAQLLLDHMGPLEPGDLPPTADVEVADGASKTQIRNALQQWMDHIEAATGRKGLIYTGPGFWNSKVGGSQFAEYPLWVAHWGPTCPTLPSGWSDWVFFQTGSHGSVNGIDGRVEAAKTIALLRGMKARRAPHPATVLLATQIQRSIPRR